MPLQNTFLLFRFLAVHKWVALTMRFYFFVAGIPSCYICTEKQAPGAGWFFLLHLMLQSVHFPEIWEPNPCVQPWKQQVWESGAVCELPAHSPFEHNTSLISTAAVPPQLSHHIELNSVFLINPFQQAKHQLLSQYFTYTDQLLLQVVKSTLLNALLTEELWPRRILRELQKAFYHNDP